MSSLIVPRLIKTWMGYRDTYFVSDEFHQIVNHEDKKVGDTLIYYSSSPNDQEEIMRITKIDDEGVWGEEV